VLQKQRGGQRRVYFSYSGASGNNFHSVDCAGCENESFDACHLRILKSRFHRSDLAPYADDCHRRAGSLLRECLRVSTEENQEQNSCG
jgi:hypothetical protein